MRSQDTIVRWSASKAVARISEALPPDFSEQILDQVLQLFGIHSIAAAALYDLPAIAEATWHGACLACAELARRGLISSEKLPELMEWLMKVGNSTSCFVNSIYGQIFKGALF
jgi:tubulin-specific chaperone D